MAMGWRPASLGASLAEDLVTACLGARSENGDLFTDDLERSRGPVWRN
jgi:hypothetical protein